MPDIAKCAGRRPDDQAQLLKACETCRRYTEPAADRQVWIQPAARRVAGTQRWVCHFRLEAACA